MAICLQHTSILSSSKLSSSVAAEGADLAVPKNRHSFSPILKKKTRSLQISVNSRRGVPRPTFGREVKSMAATITGGNSGLIDETTELKLPSIRESLIRQEDSIIYNLLERAQYKINPPTYDANRFTIPGFEGSLVEYLLQETERLHAKVRRYNSPDEHPFFPDGLPGSLLPEMQYPKVLHKAADQININPLVWKMYFDDLLPGLAAPGDDGNYGSTATSDVLCLQSLSKRIHFGKFVAEAKYRESPNVFNPHIRAQDEEALYQLITFESVELNVQRRVENKAATYGQEVVIEGARPQTLKIDPKLVGKLYWEWVMPLTKKVQVEYLLHRLDN
ncbi:unnamed protein product [Calypogeia fissa]